MITRFARALYGRARVLELGYALLGAVIAGAGIAVAVMLGHRVDPMYGVPAACIGGGVGWLKAQGPAFALRLQAQTALCQVQIERNTRSTAFHAATIAAALVAPMAGDDRGASSSSRRPIELGGREPPTQRTRRGAGAPDGGGAEDGREADQHG